MQAPPGVLYQLYAIDVEDARPSQSDTVWRTFDAEKAFAISHCEVVEWISQEFDDSPAKFLRKTATLLVVEVRYSRG